MTTDQKITASPEELTRALDPNISQRNASNPHASVWVAASAGTGKTKVLTDRVLRLLLPRDSGESGTLAHHILCLTFTKAAASEMALRINKTLGTWAVLPEDQLVEKLESLLGKTPTAQQLSAAQKLFAKVIDTPGGLKIMTIHSFCQSVLGRFPLEAGLPPYFDMMDEAQALNLITQAQTHILTQARHQPDSTVGKALHAIATVQNENQFTALLSSICSERTQLQNWFKHHDHSSLYKIFTLPVGQTEQEVLKDFSDQTPREDLYDAVRVLSEGSKTDQERAIDIKSWLEGDQQNNALAFAQYKSCFLTSKDTLRATLATKGSLQKDPQLGDILQREATRVLQTLDQIKAIQCIHYTGHILTLGQAILEHYQTIKRQKALLDYDDLILKTRDLLKKSKTSAKWILYKLDGGLEHVLVDEAQDTNPEQWDIIDHLTDEFFVGKGSSDQTRTIFTVGDEKQSIYSFQRAAPQEFSRMQEHFKQKVIQSGQKWRPEAMNISFRSTRTVLDIVDQVFDDENAAKGLGRNTQKHQSFRIGQAGVTEIWPAFESVKAEKEEPWSPPITIQEQKSGAAQLAEHIGDTIKSWIDNKEYLESHNREVQAGDIMILVRTRTAFANQLMRALKTHNITVSGSDRMILGKQIAIMDLMATLQFCLLPEDDLTLASLLKSPLIGMDEDALYDVAIDRTGTLWASLQSMSAHQDITDYLKSLITQAQISGPYGFLSHILQSPCPAHHDSGLKAMTKRLGTDAHDPMDELLNCALSYEKDELPSLQGFLSAMEKNPVTIKREMENAGNAVRIMTVHGSKGLQAPIVILPDTFMTSAGSSNKLPRLLWPDKSGLDIPLFMPSADNAPDLYKKARGHVQDKLDEEYRRLLYVAMTRAEDRLYVGGHIGGTKPREDSWYYYIQNGFKSHDDVDEFSFTTNTAAPAENAEDHDAVPQIGLRLYHPQTKEPDRAQEQAKNAESSTADIPDWLYQPAPEEPDPPRPLIPSRPSEAAPASHSPLFKDDPYRFKRGNITHMLLQTLPDMESAKRRAAAKMYLSKPSLDLPVKIQDSILEETFAILEHPEFAPIFGAGSMAEVPLTGLINGKLVSAQIDRLLITKDKISIIDYKTNRPPPLKADDIPEIYINQMSSYKDIVAKIYDCPQIDCYLLWTDGPHIMKVPL